MRNSSALQFGLLLLVSAAPALVHAQFEQPSKAELEMASDPKAPGAPAVFLDRVEVTDDPHHFATIYARIKVLTEQGKEAATVHVDPRINFVYHATGDNSSRMGQTSNHWDAPDMNHSGEDRPNELMEFKVKSEVSALQGRTIHADGKIVPLAASSLKPVAGSQNEFEFTLPDVQVGDVLEYRYQIRYDRFEGAPDWQIQKPYFVHHAHFAFSPDERFSQARTKAGSAGMQNSALVDNHGESMLDIRSGTILPPGTTVRAEAIGGYSLDMNDVPAFPKEPYASPAEGQAYRVSFYYVPTLDERDFWQRQMDFWNKTLNRYIAPTPPLQSLVKELTGGMTSPMQKAKALYAFTARIENTDFSFDGEPETGSETIPGGHVDRILTDKKATSNEIAYLYLAMARVAGLNAQPERIASRSRRLFSVQFRTAAQLDSVVIALNIEGQQITVDPGTRMAPFGVLHWAHSAAAGLTLANGKVETVITPAQKSADNAILHVGNVNVSAKGDVSGTLKIAFLGQEAIRLRQLAIKSGKDSVLAELSKTVSTQVPAGLSASVTHVAFLDDPTKQLVATVPVSGKLGLQADGRLALPRALFAARAANPFPQQSERKLNVDARYPDFDQEKIVYVLPAGYGVGADSHDASLNWNAVKYKASATGEKNGVTVSRVLSRGFTLLEADKYAPLSEIYQKIATADKETVVLATGTQAANPQ